MKMPYILVEIIDLNFYFIRMRWSVEQGKVLGWTPSKSMLLFGNFLLLYLSTQYECADRHAKGWGTNNALIKHKHG